MHLSVLPYRLRIAQLERKKCNVCALSILNIMMFSEKDRFFSYTDTTKEISLVLDEDTVKEFPDQLLVLSPKHFRALELNSSAHPQGSTGIVHFLSHPLANAGISIYYISTYETDYTLIMEEDLSKAIQYLKGSIPSLTISNSLILNHNNHNPKNEIALPDSKVIYPDIQKKKLKLSLSRNTLVLTSAPKRMLPYLGTCIIKFLFFSNSSSDRFFSYCQTNDTISIILPSPEHEILCEMAESIGFSLSSYNALWQRVSVDDGPLGFDESGIVDSIATPLAKADVNLFYVSTYETDHLLVKDSQTDKAIRTLSQSFTINQ